MRIPDRTLRAVSSLIEDFQEGDDDSFLEWLKTRKTESKARHEFTDAAIQGMTPKERENHDHVYNLITSSTDWKAAFVLYDMIEVIVRTQRILQEQAKSN